MGRFARRLRGLQNVFPSSGRDIVGPDEASELLSFVHPFPGKIAQAAVNFTAQELTSNTDVTPFGTTPFVEADVCEIIYYGQWLHDSVTARRLALSILTQGGATVVIASVSFPASPFFGLPIFGNPTDYAAGSASTLPPRPIILLPGQALLFAGDTAGVAYTINFRRLFYTPPLPSEPLFA